MGFTIGVDPHRCDGSLFFSKSPGGGERLQISLSSGHERERGQLVCALALPRSLSLSCRDAWGQPGFLLRVLPNAAADGPQRRVLPTPILEARRSGWEAKDARARFHPCVSFTATGQLSSAARRWSQR